MAAGNSPTLTLLQHQDHLDGAGCSFQVVGASARQSDVFQWDFADSAWINVSGSDVRLKLLKRDASVRQPKKTSVGDRQLLEFAGGGLTVIVRTTIKSVCPENDESCEVWSEEGTIKVIVGKKSSITRVQALCGS